MANNLILATVVSVSNWTVTLLNAVCVRESHVNAEVYKALKRKKYVVKAVVTKFCLEVYNVV